MLGIFLIYLVIYSILLTGFIFIGYYLQIGKEKNYFTDSTQKLDLSELIVIIPFRNEEYRIDELIESILKSEKFPKEFVFIDDHSDDNTVDLIRKSLNAIPHRILQMPDHLIGKKNAIRYGINDSNSNFILSLDADVGFSQYYFTSLEKLTVADMYILPAILLPKKSIEHLFEVDLVLVNAANCGISGLSRPIMASGANLLYKRSTFEKLDDLEQHAHIQSGDDIYLLRDFRHGKADIRLITDPSLAIYTETPQSFKEFIHQRLRWIAKTGDVNDKLSNSLAIVQALLTFAFVVLLVLFAVKGEWKLFTGLFLSKTTIDLILFLPFFNRIKRMKSWLFIPIYELIFPLYTLTILGMMFWFKPIWKGRQINNS